MKFISDHCLDQSDHEYAKYYQYIQTMILSTGIETATDLERAFKYCKLTVEKGHVDAQFNLGGYYVHGQGGVSKNSQEVVRRWRLAADQGHANSQYILGTCYASRWGVAKDAK